MGFRDLEELVLQQDLCASCGACAAVCPQNVLMIDIDDPVPRLRTPARDVDGVCAGCSMCTDVCPGRNTGVAESEQRVFGRRRRSEERWTGVVRDTHLALASRRDIYEAASAGGAVTSILAAALAERRVDACLVIGRDPARPWAPAPRLAADLAALIDAAQASYCIVPNLHLLRDASYERIGVVGLPCQIEAINKARNLPEVPEAIRRVAFTVEIACSSSTRRDGTRHLIEDRLRLPLADVSRMRYRAGDYPGRFTAWDAAGAEHSLPFHELVTTFTEFKTYRCQACPDWWSGLADVSVADGDPNIFKTSRQGAHGHKSSTVLTRTPIGDSLVALAVSTGFLSLTTATFDPETSLGLQRKRHRYARYRDRYPERVPTAPGIDDNAVHALSDNEVIERMSNAP